MRIRTEGQLDRLFANIAIFPFDDRAARRAAEARVDPERRGLFIGPMDNPDARTGATLVTHNVAAFGRVAELSIEDWF